MSGRIVSFAAAAILGFIAQTGSAAMYKWVDERGVVHYGDRLPTQSRVSGEFNRATGTARTSAQPTAVTLEEAERQKAEAKRKLLQDRQDVALLATYSHEGEIDAARDRELKRHQEILQVATDGLAKSNNPDDKRKLDRLLAQGQQGTDAINARFAAQKMRYRALKAPPELVQAPTAQSFTPSP